MATVTSIKFVILITVSLLQDLIALRLDSQVCDPDIWSNADNIKNLEGQLLWVCVDVVVNMWNVQSTKLRNTRQPLQEKVLSESVHGESTDATILPSPWNPSPCQALGAAACVH